MTHEPSNAATVNAYVRSLARRMWCIYALRGLALAGGAAALALFAAALFAPPVLTTGSAALVWCGVTLLALAAFALVLWPAARYRGPRVALLLAERDPVLAARMRSALELASAPPEQASRELVAAHLAEVEHGLVALPEARVLPFRRVLHVTTLLGLLAGLICAVLLVRDPRAQLFLRGLRAPAAVQADGTRVAEIAQHVRVRVSYPGYLDRPALTFEDPRELDVPAGSHIELRVTPQFAAARGALRTQSGELALLRLEDGTLEARFTAQKSDQLHVRIESDGVRYEDPRAIALHVAPDTKPTIRIEDPQNGAFVTREASITLRFVANDDVGLAAVDMYVRTADGVERQRRLFSALDDGGAKASLRASVELVPDELGAREGDTLVVWLEARDEDAIHGPNIGKSAEVSLEVTSRGRSLSGFIPDLQAIADQAVDVLADRLESDVPEDIKAARSRFANLERGARAWLGKLDALLLEADRAEASGVIDSDQLRGVKRRNLRLLGAEAALHTSIRGKSERAQADARSVDELERDVLLLADMLAKAHVDEAKLIAEELRGLKQKIEELLAQLGKSQSPEAQRELMAEIAKAERRLAELAQSLSRMATRVPSEFVNREAVPQEQAQSTLADLERAVRDNDLQAAANHLDALAKQIDELASQLGEGGLKLAESRYGPRDKALAAARQQLDLLASEQQRLAERSAEVASGAQQRGQGPDGAERARQLAPQAQSLEQQVSELADESPQGWRSSAMGRAQERLRDAHAALQTGDLAQARSMSEAGERSLREASAELAAEANMFGGPNGETAERARRADRAKQDAERLSRAIAQAIPDASEHMTEAERQRLRGDLDPQRKAREGARALEEAFSKGPDGLPLSPEAVESMQAVRDSMRQAEQALEQGEAESAAREQKDASERLKKASQQLAQKQQGGASGGSQGGGNQNARAEAPVKIPGESDWKGPTELRRKLLDAMHENSPTGFESAVERYYEELLR